MFQQIAILGFVAGAGAGAGRFLRAAGRSRSHLLAALLDRACGMLYALLSCCSALLCCYAAVSAALQAMLLGCGAALLLCCSAALLICCSAALLVCKLCCSAALLLCCSAALLLCRSVALLLCCSAALLLSCSASYAARLWCCSAALLLCCSGAMAWLCPELCCELLLRVLRGVDVRLQNAVGVFGELIVPP